MLPKFLRTRCRLHTARQLPEALKAEEQSLKLSPYSTAAWNNLGGILTNLERCAEAKSAYRKALEIEPENTGAMIGLAQLLHDGRGNG